MKKFAIVMTTLSSHDDYHINGKAFLGEKWLLLEQRAGAVVSKCNSKDFDIRERRGDDHKS